MGHTTAILAMLVTAPVLGAQSHHTSSPPSAAALQQIRDVQQAAAGLSTTESARAAGYEPSLGWIAMMGTHWVHGPRMLEGRNVKLTQPSQLMFSPVGGKETLVGVAFAYYAPLADAAPPALFDGAPAWHDHPGLAPPGTNLVMLHVWFVASPDGPFAGLNPFLPFWGAGVTPPDLARMQDPAVSLRVRKAAVALAEIVDTGGLFPVLARRAPVRAVLEERRTAIRALIPNIEAARKQSDQTRWDALMDTLGEHWDAMQTAYVTSALDPDVKVRIAKSIDEMIKGGHVH